MYTDGSQSGLTPDGKPLPIITPLNEGFWQNARNSVFTIQTCMSCRDQHIPESPVCPRCLSEDQEWVPASGQGTLESWVEFHRAYWDGFKTELPYLVGLVKLAEGPLFVARLRGGGGDLQQGRPVRITFRKASKDVFLPELDPA